MAPLWSAIAACAASRGATVVGVDEPGKVNAIDNPRVLTDASLRWELAPLASVAITLTQCGELKAAWAAAWWLPNALRLLGRLNEARAVSESLLANPDDARASVGEFEFAGLLSNLALIQQDQGHLAAARASIEQAIAIGEQLDPPHLAQEVRYSNLAMIQWAQGDLPAASASIDRAIIGERFLDPEDPAMASRYSNRSLIQRSLGVLVAAQASIERAIAIEVKHLGPEHPTLAASYSNLALIQRGRGDLPGARESIGYAIAIGEKHLDAQYLPLVNRYFTLAMIDLDLGDLPSARASMERSIAMGEKVLHSQHPPQQAIRYFHLARICNSQGAHAANCENLKKALGILLRFDEAHPHVQVIRESMKDAGCVD
jgi:tetratricopeptide (TPR) repeat protein